MFARTHDRVDHEMLVDREVFLDHVAFEADPFGEYQMTKHNNLAIVDVAGGEDYELILPHAVGCKGLAVCVRGIVSQTGKLTISGTGLGDAVEYDAAGSNLTVASLFVSDGAVWYATSASIGAVGAAGADGLDGSTWHHGNETPDDATLGEDGDYHLRLDTGALSFKVAGAWTLLGTFTFAAA